MTEVTVPRVPLPLDCLLPKSTVWVLFLSPHRVLDRISGHPNSTEWDRGTSTQPSTPGHIGNGTEVYLHGLDTRTHWSLSSDVCQSASRARILNMQSLNCSKMQILRSHPESETWWMRTSNLYFNKPWGDSDALKFENLCSRRDAAWVRQSSPASVYGYCVLVAFHLHVLSTGFRQPLAASACSHLLHHSQPGRSRNKDNPSPEPSEQSGMGELECWGLGAVFSLHLSYSW